MILGYIVLIVALSVSGIAAWYSIVGLLAIFSGATVPIMIMGGSLEIAKLVIASWLYRYWKTIPRLLKGYFIFALAILMTLTSLGIFGFLSNSHITSAAPSGEIIAKIERIDMDITKERERINRAEKIITQLDSALDSMISAGKSEGALNLRTTQKRERGIQAEEIKQAQASIDRLLSEKSPLASEMRKIEAEFGPIKYVAELLYGSNPDKTVIDSAVRVVIIIIVTVFDPLAVLMVIAANMTIRGDLQEKIVETQPQSQHKKQKRTRKKEAIVATETTELDLDQLFPETTEEDVVDDVLNDGHTKPLKTNFVSEYEGGEPTGTVIRKGPVKKRSVLAKK